MSFPMVAMGEVLTSVSRPESIDPEKEYRILGAHWYAKGLYIKDIKSGSGIQATKVYRIEKGDFVYNRLFAWKGSFAVATNENHGCYVSNEFPYFKVDSDCANSKYLWLYFSRLSIWEEALGLSSGGTPTSRNRLKEEKFLAMQISLPPLAEQHRIVACIEELAAKIEEARGLRRQTVAEIEALLNACLKGTRENLFRSNYPKNRIGQITQVSSGGTPLREVSLYWDGEIPWVKTGELLDSDIYKTEEYITKEGLENSSAKLFPPETILIALYGQGQTRGRTGRLMFEATTNQACCAVLPAPSSFEPRFMQYWLRSLYVEMREKSHGGAQPNWNGQMIKNIEIAIPPLPEQRHIVAYLDELQAKIDALRRLQAETGAGLDALMPAVMDRAFKGEL